MNKGPGLYKHYKGGLYRVIAHAIESTNGRDGQEVVVYISLEKGLWYTRNAIEFYSTVALECGFPLGPTYVRETPRFERVGD